MKKHTNNDASMHESPVKRQRIESIAFVTPPRDTAKNESELPKQLWSVGGNKTNTPIIERATSTSSKIHITRNRDFGLPNNHGEVLAANFVAKYKELKEINNEVEGLRKQLSDEVEILRKQLKSLEVVTPEKTKKTKKAKAAASKGTPSRMAEKRKKIAKINRTLENLFIGLLPNVESTGEIDDILDMVISQLNSNDKTEIINTLVTAINKSYENPSNTPEQKITSFSNRLQIITFINEAKLTDIDHNLWSNLHGYREISLQLSFEQELENLGMHFIPLNKLRQGSTKRTRIVFTDLKTSIDGFKYMQHWFATNADASTNITEFLKNTGAKTVNADESRPADLDLEIAWLHLMNDGRHLEENLVFVGDLKSLEYAVKFCTIDSTLVLNAHGGQNEFTINKMTSDGPKKSVLMGPSLTAYMKSIVEIINEKITHFILTTCATGNISANPNLKTQDKYIISDDNTADLNRQKNRKKIFIDNACDISNLEEVLGSFGKLAIGSNSAAATLAKLLFEREKQDLKFGTAFTFSPTIIHPGTSPDGGIIAAPKGLGVNRRDWPEYNTDWQLDGSGLPLNVVAYKSYTLYNSLYNRKALGSSGEWKRGLHDKKLRWGVRMKNEDHNIFAPLNSVFFELIKSKTVTSENSFVSAYQTALISPGVKFNSSGGAAIMQAFVKSILDENSNLGTPFDHDMIALCDQIISSKASDMEIEVGVTNLLDADSRNAVYEAHAESTQIASHINSGSKLYDYLKQHHNVLISRIKQSYCKNLADPKILSCARYQDILHIARKLGCFAQVYEHCDDKQIKVHILNNNPAALTLHIKNIGDREWKIAALDIDGQKQIAAQQEAPAFEAMSWPYASYTIHKKGIARCKQPDNKSNHGRNHTYIEELNDAVRHTTAIRSSHN